jgi:PAS domain S-box-containing protein
MHNPPENQPPDRETFQRAGDVTCAYDLSGNITFLSEEGERISGYTCAEARRMNIADLLDPEIAGEVFEQVLSDTQKGVGTVSEIDLIAKDGRRVPLEVSMRAVLVDEHRIEIQGIAIPSVIRDPSLSLAGLRCLDEDFSFGSSTTVSEILARIQ